MSLISLLIALAAEKALSSKAWQFNTYYAHYMKQLRSFNLLESLYSSNVAIGLLVLIPAILVGVVQWILDEPILNFLFSTLVLVVCFGCAAARSAFKAYLMSAFRGDKVSCELREQELREGRHCEQGDCDEMATSFGQTLIWINYRYYFAIMVFFIVFGAAGTVSYRLLVTLSERRKVEDIAIPDEVESATNKALYYIDWLPVRLASFGYMFVGHFSKALPVWLENLLDFDVKPQQFLAKVAKASEDHMIDDKDDCTAEPCILVKLAKRTMLLSLALISMMTLTGAVS